MKGIFKLLCKLICRKHKNNIKIAYDWQNYSLLSIILLLFCYFVKYLKLWQYFVKKIMLIKLLFTNIAAN